MANEEPKAAKTTVITTKHAQGIRRQHGRESNKILRTFLDEHRWTIDKVNILEWIRSVGGVAAQRRRPPSQGVPSGVDIIEINPDADSGEFIFSMCGYDKKGIPLMSRRLPILLRVSKHATEALFQRLRTQDVMVVLAELRPVGAWLLENQAMVAMETNGYLLSPNGIFPVVAGDPYQTEGMDGRHHWVATTWIADTGLADNSERKRRIAVATRQARDQGMRVGFLPSDVVAR